MLRKNHHAAVTALLLALSVSLMVPKAAFALGPPPLSLDSTVTPTTQEINAGNIAVYNVTMHRSDFYGWFNVTVGLRSTREQAVEQNMLVAPLPKGVEAIYPKQVYLDRAHVGSSFPVVIKISADVAQTEMWLTVLISGRYNAGGDLGNQTFYSNNDVKLVVAPLGTSLGVASTLLFEGFNQNPPPDWTFNQTGGNVRVMGDNFPNHFTFLELEDNWPSRHVDAKRLIPSPNNSSFIAEFKLRPETPNHFQMMFELTAANSDTNSSTVISAGFSDGRIQVQNKSYNEYIVDNWYQFRFEVDAKQRTFKWYLDGKYMDTLAWSGSPVDGIRITTTDSEIGTGDVAEIFVQKIIIPATELNTTILTTTVTTTATSTITTTVTTEVTKIETVTSTTTGICTTTLSTSITGGPTATTHEGNTDSTAYGWAISATVAAVVLAIVLLAQRRRTG